MPVSLGLKADLWHACKTFKNNFASRYSNMIAEKCGQISYSLYLFIFFYLFFLILNITISYVPCYTYSASNIGPIYWRSVAT